MADFVKVASVDDVPAGSMKKVKAGGTEVCLANVDGKFYAIGNICTHRGGPLAEGDLDGNIVTCPWHGATFDVTTGKVTGPPAPRDEPKFEVKVEGGDVLVKV